MNIVAFVRPKEEVVFLYDDYTLTEAIEKLEKFRYTSVPIISRDGYYVGTLTEGDLLWDIKKHDDFCLSKANDRLVSSVKRNRDYQAININSNITELISKATDENFVPVVNDHNMFLGIVTRKTILNYFFEHNFIIL
jgi:CBS domain-containing protein